MNKKQNKSDQTPYRALYVLYVPYNFYYIAHYFQIRGRSDLSFRKLIGRRGRQQREVGEVNGN
jgi:hypothetical protein